MGPSRAARAASAPWSQFPQTRRSARPFQAPRKNSVGSSRPRSPAFAGLVLAGRKGHASHRHRSGLKIPPRPLSVAGAPSAKCCAILTEERGGRTGNASSPLSFPPFGNPPFLIPPPNSNPPKGGKPQGALARRPLWRGWGNRGAPLPPRSRAPPPCGFPVHSAACPPCSSAPEGPGAQSGLHAVRALTTIPALQGVRKLTHDERQSLSPLAPYRPRRGRARWFLCCT